jgi:hypothetical protein
VPARVARQSLFSVPIFLFIGRLTAPSRGFDSVPKSLLAVRWPVEHGFGFDPSFRLRGRRAEIPAVRLYDPDRHAPSCRIERAISSSAPSSGPMRSCSSKIPGNRETTPGDGDPEVVFCDPDGRRSGSRRVMLPQVEGAFSAGIDVEPVSGFEPLTVRLQEGLLPLEPSGTASRASPSFLPAYWLVRLTNLF